MSTLLRHKYWKVIEPTHLNMLLGVHKYRLQNYSDKHPLALHNFSRPYKKNQYVRKKFIVLNTQLWLKIVLFAWSSRNFSKILIFYAKIKQTWFWSNYVKHFHWYHRIVRINIYKTAFNIKQIKNSTPYYRKKLLNIQH